MYITINSTSIDIIAYIRNLGFRYKPISKKSSTDRSLFKFLYLDLDEMVVGHCTEHCAISQWAVEHLDWDDNRNNFYNYVQASLLGKSKILGMKTQI